MSAALLQKASVPLPAAAESLPFGSVPPDYHIRAFGVDYIRLPDAEGGFLYVTRWGWHRLAHLKPGNWFADRRFAREGSRLTGSTGTVYQFSSRPAGRMPISLLVKVSRLAEDVPGQLSTEAESAADRPDARFNSPFEEVGLVEDLRRGRWGPPDLHVRTKRPLAIYCSPRDLPAWQLGRKPFGFESLWEQLDQNQGQEPEGLRVHLLRNRQYFMLYAWVPGIDAQQAMEEGLLTEAEVAALTHRANRELALKGFRILDNKPKHFILRKEPQGGLLRHHGDLIYVQIDFELMERTEAYRLTLGGDRLEPAPGDD